MRPRLLPVLAAALAAALVAQPATAQLRLGARGGWNRADVRTQEGLDFTNDTRNGFLLGGYLEGGITGRWGFNVGAQYSQKGIHTEYADGVEIELAIDYVEAPLLLMMAMPSQGAFAMGLYGGFAPAFKVKCVGRAAGGTRSVEETCGQNDPDVEIDVGPVKSFDLGGVVGGGLGLNLGSTQVVGEVLYNWGLLEFADDDNTESDSHDKNRVLSLTVGVSIPLGGAPSDSLLN